MKQPEMSQAAIRKLLAAHGFTPATKESLAPPLDVYQVWECFFNRDGERIRRVFTASAPITEEDARAEAFDFLCGSDYEEFENIYPIKQCN
jgi:hypothetical protein